MLSAHIRCFVRYEHFMKLAVVHDFFRHEVVIAIGLPKLDWVMQGVIRS